MTSEHALHLDLTSLAFAIAEDGVTAHEASVARFARRAAARHLDPVLIGVVADPDAPRAARERAFGQLATRWAASAPPRSSSSPPPRPHAEEPGLVA